MTSSLISSIRPFRRLCRLPSLRILLVLFFIGATFDVLQIRFWLPSPITEKERTLQGQPKIFIASIHWNTETILRHSWNDALLALVKAVGPENVFISIYESGSFDNSKGALRELDEALGVLGVPRKITLSETTHQDEISQKPEGPGWIRTPRGRDELRRIPYLSRLRNISLQPLEELTKSGEKFDKILFLNDVVFTVDDIFTLFNTNNGEYAAACSLDFARPPKYYDTFALRDSKGHETVEQTWPYFRTSRSRHALERQMSVLVKSCWNGIVVMDAAPFLSETPLRFRGIPDSLATEHLEGSECCLIHADNPLSATKGVYLNPKVRVGYNPQAYDLVHSKPSWLSSYQIFKGLWSNRLHRWVTIQWLKEYVVRRRVSRWKEKDGTNVEPGVFCLINEMQVLVFNGWAHV